MGFPYGSPEASLVTEPAPIIPGIDPIRAEALRLAVFLYARSSGMTNTIGDEATVRTTRAAVRFEQYLRGGVAQ